LISALALGKSGWEKQRKSGSEKMAVFEFLGFISILKIWLDEYRVT
jgi:hypothetical protein